VQNRHNPGLLKIPGMNAAACTQICGEIRAGPVNSLWKNSVGVFQQRVLGRAIAL
jgi:hypothetical protein